MPAPPLISLPAELIQQILSYTNEFDLARVAQTCRHLHAASYDDQIWLALINANLPSPISTPSPCKSFRDLFVAHCPHWFLAKHRIWFGDSEPSGKLVIARYNERTGCIEANTVVATRGQHTFASWEKDPSVILHHFDPRVSLDLNQAVLKLPLDNAGASRKSSPNSGKGPSAQEPIYSREIVMETFAETGLYSSFMLCRSLPEAALFDTMRVWPPMHIPAVARTRNHSQDRFSSSGHRPTRHSEVSHNTFRLRKWMDFAGRRSHPGSIPAHVRPGFTAALGQYMPLFEAAMNHGGSSLRLHVPEDITTFATLPESCYRPTPQKPWQGIWCGDYSGHGCEFLVIYQPDRADERPLPQSMNWLLPWFRHGRRSSESSTNSFVSAQEEIGAAQGESDEGESAPGASEYDLQDILRGFIDSPRRRDRHRAGDMSSGSFPSGRLEAIKLTGDPNIPRGEYTFIAPEIGDEGLVRVADEQPFRGARIVRSAGHIAGEGFRQDQYTPSQLIMISPNRLAQFWEAFGHISHYQRVDLDAL